jgi:hypothetical protein
MILPASYRKRILRRIEGVQNLRDPCRFGGLEVFTVAVRALDIK